MNNYYTASELGQIGIDALPSTSRGIQYRAESDGWSFIEKEAESGGGKNGIVRAYLPPADILAKIHAKKVEAAIAEKTSLVPVTTSAVTTIDRRVSLSDVQRNIENARHAVLSIIDNIVLVTGLTRSKAILAFMKEAASNEQHIALLQAARDTRGAYATTSPVPDRRTIERWYEKRESQSLAPAMPQKDMSVPFWAPTFLDFYRRPQKPSVAWAHAQTCAVLANVPSVDAMHRYLKKLGTVEANKGRLGTRELANIRVFKRRDISHLLPSDIYTADGHTFDAEVAHPLHGRPWRPEITTIADVATRKIVGFSIALAESSLAVLEAITHASTSNGIPAIFYVDNGPGYKNDMMEAEGIGLMGRLGCTMTNSLPYNAKAKGVIERLHKTVWVRAAKELATYMGVDVDREHHLAMFKITRAALKDDSLKTPLLSFKQFLDFAAQQVERYNNSPHSTLAKITDDSGRTRHMTPNESWNQFIADGVQLVTVQPEERKYLFMPRLRRIVQRGEINMMSHRYFSKDLEEFHGDTVNVAYDIHDASYVFVYDSVGRFICQADFEANKTDYYPVSFIEQKRNEREQGRLQRAEARIEEITAERKGGAIEMSPSIQIGGLDLNVNELEYADARAKESLATMQTPEQFRFVEEKTEDVKVETDSFYIPDTPDERFDMYLELSVRNDLVGRAAVWVRTYTKTAEFRAMSKQYAHSN